MLILIVPEENVVDVHEWMSTFTINPTVRRVARAAMYTMGTPGPERKVPSSAMLFLLCTRGSVRGPRDPNRVLLLPWLLLPYWLLFSLVDGLFLSLGSLLERLCWLGG